MRVHSNPSTFSILHVNNFFQITISEFLGRSNESFQLDRLSSVKRLQGDPLLILCLRNFVLLVL